ncbi:MAG: AAA family ATPase [Candidatus Omnitrophica bacterium]|nr:AAA family ATPase [Candidatus Omnitrophota bacterium]MCG2704226.1 AAA family ATPase [Candidatus Omnitrophota bacterium]
MKRDLERELFRWKEHKDRLPLLLRGARQVGKSYIVEGFGKKAFKNLVVVNFEFRPELKQCFTTLDPIEIINKLQLLMGVTIEAETTLLFLDEIQECPNAIMALRYFKEKYNRLAVIGAGSLMEFTLNSPDFRMPVGRIQFIYLEPLSFGEFLTASGNERLRHYLQGIGLNSTFDDVVHQKLMDLLRIYLIVGGMPAVVKEYLENRNFLNCRRIQNSLLQTYRSDFGKYAKTSEHKYLQKVFDAAPRLVGSRVKYSNIDSASKSRDIKQALNLLKLAGIIHPVYATAASGLPLGAQANETKFKLNFLDVGLMQNACGLQTELTLTNDFIQINAGAVTEQLIGQELRAYFDSYLEHNLFFWARDKKSSSAEVDYVVVVDSLILPVEVKAGKTGTLKSLKLFIEEKDVSFGIRFSQEKLSLYDKVLTLPLYMAEQMRKLAQEANVKSTI